MADTENRKREVIALIRQDDNLRRGLRVHVVVLIMAGLVLAGVGLLAVILDVPGSVMTREAQITLGGAFYAGALSNLGALIWMVGVVLALVGWSTSCDPDERRMFLAGATIGAALLVDDFFLVHDWVHTHSRVLERGLLFSYFIAVGGLVIFFWRTMGALAVAGVLAALGLMAGSAALDVLFNDIDQLLEDGMKFLGICTWATVWVMRARPWQFRPSPS